MAIRWSVGSCSQRSRGLHGKVGPSSPGISRQKMAVLVPSSANRPWNKLVCLNFSFFLLNMKAPPPKKKGLKFRSTNNPCFFQVLLQNKQIWFRTKLGRRLTFCQKPSKLPQLDGAAVAKKGHVQAVDMQIPRAKSEQATYSRWKVYRRHKCLYSHWSFWSLGTNLP